MSKGPGCIIRLRCTRGPHHHTRNHVAGQGTRSRTWFSILASQLQLQVLEGLTPSWAHSLNEQPYRNNSGNMNFLSAVQFGSMPSWGHQGVNPSTSPKNNTGTGYFKRCNARSLSCILFYVIPQSFTSSLELSDNASNSMETKNQKSSLFAL